MPAVQKLVRIRPFQPADQAAARDLILTGLGEHFGHIDATLNPDLQDIWTSYTARGGHFFVAQRDSVLVGTGGLVLEAEDIWRIVRVSVASQHRRLGIGKRMTRHLIATARDLGASAIVVETNQDWLDAISLYLRCGFAIEAYRDGECHLRLVLPR